MKVLKYEIRFESENKYGVISKSTHSRKEAYRIYHKIKEEMEFRLGRVFIVEHYTDGTIGQLCSYHTGRDYDALQLLEEMIKINKQLIKVYNQDFLNEKRSELDKMQNNIEHALEMVDCSKIDDEDKFNAYVVDKMKNVRLIRREIKLRQAVAYKVSGKLNVIKNELSAARNIVKDRADGAKRDNSQDPANIEKKIQYLESIGLDAIAYDKESEDALPKDLDLTPIVLYKKQK
jgi:predicted phage tail protein